MRSRTLYQQDLAWIHHHGYGDFARSAGWEVLRILRRSSRKGGVLVDLGCGSGIWAARAQRGGFRVIGIDSSAPMLALARHESPESTFVRTPLQDFLFPPCDVVTALGEPLNYRNGRQAPDLRRLFARIARALRPGGRFIFDVILADGKPMNYRTWRAGIDWAVLVGAQEEPARRTLTREMLIFREVGGRIRRGTERHIVQLFRKSEVERALHAAGFRFVSSRRYGAWPLPPRRMAFMATKPLHAAQAAR